MGLAQLNFAGLNKIEVALMRIREFEPPDGYWLAFSGGKDSVVVYDLAVKSGANFTSHYCQTGIDPPELVQFIRQNYPDVAWCKPEKSIWKWIEEKGFPLRSTRWCCEKLKELHGRGDRLLTGVRWQESPARKRRRMFEVCRTYKNTSFPHPIIDWSESEVWEYIHRERLPYCSLYDEGFKRLGCVLCPLTSQRQAVIEMKRWPKLADAWYRAGRRYYESTARPNVKRWATYDDIWRWWISRSGGASKDACSARFI